MPSSPNTSGPKHLEVEEKLEITAAGKGDYRGRFGYGRPAHGSDPDAQYEFGEQQASQTAPEPLRDSDPQLPTLKSDNR